MMILLSLREIYYDSILQGVKRFEFRRRLPKGLQKGDEVAIYCTHPNSRVVAYVEVENIIQASPKMVWRKTSFAAGVDHKAFSIYFSDVRQANAIQIGTIHKLKKPLSLDILRDKLRPPQSFLYLTEEEACKVRADTFVSPCNLSVFVGGVHGTGKATFLQRTLKELGFSCFSASDLIRRHRLSLRKDKKVKDVARNQDGLIKESRIEASQHNLYALDGHFSLLTETGEIQVVPIEVFADLKVDSLFLLQASPEEIHERMVLRDGIRWSKRLIKSFIQHEEAQADLISSQLNIPLLKMSSGNASCWKLVKAFIQKVLTNKFGEVSKDSLGRLI